MTTSKEKIGKLLRAAGDVFTLNIASKVLETNTTDTSKTLARWVKQGWLIRVRRGLYAIVPLDTSQSEYTIVDPWVVVPELFPPCYIGGWSALEYWDFTEQIFKNICVLTEQVHKKNVEIYNTTFMLTKISREVNFGTKIVWRQNQKILISDPHKTIVDILDNPDLGGGIEHTIDSIKEYLKSKFSDIKKLSEYGLKMNNGAIFKRLGYISENLLGKEHDLTEICRNNLTKGYAYLDPNIKESSLITRWNLFIPKNIVIEL